MAIQKISDRKKEIFFSELSSLLSSGLDFSGSFRMIIEGETDKKMKKIEQGIYDRVLGGEMLCDAMSKVGNDFSVLDRGVVRIGEETGRLEETLSFLADHYRKKIDQARMISSGISYPMVIIFTAIVVVTFMMIVVVPMFEEVYARMGGELPGISKWIISASKKFPAFCMVTATVLLVAGAALWFTRKSERYRRLSSSLILNLPVVGYVVAGSQQARFCKLLYLLTSSGVPLLRGISLMSEMTSFYPYHRTLLEVEENLKKGMGMASTLESRPGLFRRRLLVLLKVAEERNRLPEVLKREGEEITKDLEHKIKIYGSMMEPVLILFVGVIVAVILISMYLPMFKLGGVM